LAALPERCRAVLVLCCLEGLTQDEAARQLGCSRSTLKRRLEEGRARLRKQLVRHGLTLPAALLAATLTVRAGAALPPVLAPRARRSWGRRGPAPGRGGRWRGAWRASSPGARAACWRASSAPRC